MGNLGQNSRLLKTINSNIVRIHLHIHKIKIRSQMHLLISISRSIQNIRGYVITLTKTCHQKVRNKSTHLQRFSISSTQKYSSSSQLTTKRRRLNHGLIYICWVIILTIKKWIIAPLSHITNYSNPIPPTPSNSTSLINPFTILTPKNKYKTLYYKLKSRLVLAKNKS